MVIETMSSGSFLFATGYDLTLCSQHIGEYCRADSTVWSRAALAANADAEVAAKTAPFEVDGKGMVVLPSTSDAAEAQLAKAREGLVGRPFSGAPTADERFLPSVAFAVSKEYPFGVTDLTLSHPEYCWNRWLLGVEPHPYGERDFPPGLVAASASAAAASTPAMSEDEAPPSVTTTRPLLTLPGISSFVPPLMQGFVKEAPALDIAKAAVNLTLISRRSCLHVGTRFFTRGLDVRGAPANSAQTEQIMTLRSGAVVSFVQLRGSIPLLWDQRPSLRWTPKVTIAEQMASEAVFRRHAASLAQEYRGPVMAVCLIDRKGDQQMLGDAFGRAVVSHLDKSIEDTGLYDNVDLGVQALEAGKWSYVWFDFHHECRGMKWGNLRKLLSQASERVWKATKPSHPGSTVPLAPDFGVFWALGAADGGSVVSKQRGVVRTNCMDNLDRTNVVQSLFARRAALAAVSECPWNPALDDPSALWEASLDPSVTAKTAGVLASEYDGFERAFMNAWADNADAMSLLYSGTKALKTDFTRTGKNTVMGKVFDGYHSVSRWFLGNFQDGRTQDAWDVVSGAVRFGRATAADFPQAPASGEGSADKTASSATAGAGHGGSPSATIVSAKSAGAAIRAHLASIAPSGFLLRLGLAVMTLAATATAAISTAHATMHLDMPPHPVAVVLADFPWSGAANGHDLMGGVARSLISPIADLVGVPVLPRLTPGAMVGGAALACLVLMASGVFAIKYGVPSAVVEPAIRRLAPKPKFDRSTFHPCDGRGGGGKPPKGPKAE
jgi:hypothetical protein